MPHVWPASIPVRAHRRGVAAVDVLPAGDKLAQVGDAIEVLAGGVAGGQGGGALVEGEVLEGALVGLVEADHGGLLVCALSGFGGLRCGCVGADIRRHAP